MNYTNNSDLEQQISDLISRLSELAMEWRGQPENRNRLKEEYHLTMGKLFSLGWNETLDVDCELPDKDMPEEYNRRHPYVPPTGEWPSSWGGQ
jgi:hypothetical protein